MASDIVNDLSDSERRNLLPPHGLLFLISSKGSFICTIPRNKEGFTLFNDGGGGGGGGTIYMPISTEGSGMLTTRPKTGSLV